MRLRVLLLLVAGSIPAPAIAGDAHLFSGVDVFGSAVLGSSKTTDGGAPVAGGGIVGNLRFGPAIAIGGHVGYQFDNPFSAFLSYRYTQGDVGWDVSFPRVGVSSGFEGSSISNALLGNVGYQMPLSETTAVTAHAGVGLSINTLSGVTEFDNQTGQFLATLADHSVWSSAAQIGLGIEHEINSSAKLSLGTSLLYLGGFETDAFRTGNLGTTEINPYRLNDVWTTGLNLSLRFEF